MKLSKKEAFISETVHNTVSIYVKKDILPEIPKLDDFWGIMEKLSIWKTNIGDTHTGRKYTGWEFNLIYSPTVLQDIVKRITGVTVEID